MLSPTATRKSPTLSCVFCRAERVTVVSVAADYRSVQIKCAICLKESRLAFPRLRSQSPTA